ncbi:alpha/beta hydrolase [Thalassospira marina]|uniref:Alpha/beta hydrolase n=1 Tax=Thalassospira marina TaxID=2048283 RepID=A0ABN5FHJ2_9PROT|nr:alpha/beta hydrolase [Thalassospira marina]
MHDVSAQQRARRQRVTGLKFLPISRIWAGLVLLPVLAFLVACAPTIRPAGDPVSPVAFIAASAKSDRADPAGVSGYFQTADGTQLALQSWLPGDLEGAAGAGVEVAGGAGKAAVSDNKGAATPPTAVVLALHGFGDYANGLAEAGQALRGQDIAVYAYDQRGFGRSPTRGFWPGMTTLVQDASDALMVLHHRYPDVPVYLAGVSMGAAVATLTAATRPQLMDGVILVSPAVWDRGDMPWYQTLPLSVLSHSLPWLPVSGRGLEIWPSDNIEMLRRLSRDHNMLSSVRVDMVAGLADLMDRARMRAGDLHLPVLLMTGRRDQVIPPAVMADFARDLPENGGKGGLDNGSATICVYEKGYHMLLRDLNGPHVIADMAAWIKGRPHSGSAQCR